MSGLKSPNTKRVSVDENGNELKKKKKLLKKRLDDIVEDKQPEITEPIDDADEVDEQALLAATKQAEQTSLVLHNGGAVTTVKQELTNYSVSRNSATLLAGIQHKPTKKLFTWYRDPNPYKLHMYDVLPNGFNVKVTTYDAKAIQAKKDKGFTSWTKTRDVTIWPKQTQCGIKDKLIPRQFSVLYPFMKVGFAVMGEFGNKDEDGKFAPGNKIHKYQRKVTVSEEAFDEVSDDKGRNPISAAMMDWKRKLEEEFSQQVTRMLPKVCPDVMESCRSGAEELVSDSTKQFYYGRPAGEVTKQLFMDRMKKIVKTNKDSKLRQVTLSFDMFRMLTDEEKKNGYSAPSEGLKALIDEMDTIQYVKAQQLKAVTYHAVNELPVYVSKTKEELVADHKVMMKLKETNHDEFLLQQAVLSSPYRRVPFEETFLIEKDHLVAPLVYFTFNEGASNPEWWGLTEHVVALFWEKPVTAKSFDDTLMSKPFLFDEE